MSPRIGNSDTVILEVKSTKAGVTSTRQSLSTEMHPDWSLYTQLGFGPFEKLSHVAKNLISILFHVDIFM